MKKLLVTPSTSQAVADNPAYAIQPWQAEFAAPEMETAYREHVQGATARHLRVTLVLWALMILVFGVLDYADLGATAPFYVLLAMRVLQATLLFGLAVWVGNKPQLATNGWPATLVAIAGFPMYFVIFFLRPDIFGLNLGVIMLLFIGMYLFLPNRVMLTTLIALVGIAGSLLSFVLLDLPVSEIFTLLPVLLLPPFTGFVAAHRLQLVQRQEFARLNEVERTNQALVLEIVRRKELELELQRQATTDPLTGLCNRRQYESLFNRERERCLRQGTRIVIGIIDLDHFKGINDTYGHHLGDKVLCHVARVLQQPLRQADVLGRFGGEEFILILPDTTVDEARPVTERLRQTLENTPMIWEGKQLQLTATFAITEVSPDDLTIEDPIRRADEALYQGKQAGRNRVVVALAA